MNLDITVDPDEMKRLEEEYAEAEKRVEAFQEAKFSPDYVPPKPEEPEYVTRLRPMTDEDTGQYTMVNGERMTSYLVPNLNHPRFAKARQIYESLPPHTPNRVEMAVAMSEQQKTLDVPKATPIIENSLSSVMQHIENALAGWSVLGVERREDGSYVITARMNNE